MSVYQDTKNNPPAFYIKGTPREVKIDLVSNMCDNKYRWTLKKNEEGDYKLNTHMIAYSDFLLEVLKDDIEWMADDGDWANVFTEINKGKVVITNVKSR